MSREPANRDAIAAELAAQQHGVLSMRQLAAAGLDEARVTYRTRTGRLHRIHRGVYAVGHSSLSDEGRWMAAVLAVGSGGVLSHMDAAALWKFLDLKFLDRRNFEQINITVPGTGGRDRRKGIRVHRSTTLTAADVTRRDGIPVTTPARTIADLRRTTSPTLVGRAIRQAQLDGFTIDEGSPRTRSELEDEFLRICRRHGLPRPEVNATLGGFEVDFLWRAQRLIVELDTHRYHGTPSNFESDRARDTRLTLLGYRVVRFTGRQLDQHRGELVRTLKTLLHA